MNLIFKIWTTYFGLKLKPLVEVILDPFNRKVYVKNVNANDCSVLFETHNYGFNFGDKILSRGEECNTPVIKCILEETWGENW